MRRRARPLLAVVSFLPCWGCSLIFVRGQPAPAAAGAPDAQCTRAYVAPALDVVATVVLGGLGAAAVATQDSPGCPGQECYFNGGAAVRGAGVLFLGAAAVSAASSIYGFAKVDRCQTRTGAREGCSRGDAAACAQFVPMNRPLSAVAAARVDAPLPLPAERVEPDGAGQFSSPREDRPRPPQLREPLPALLVASAGAVPQSLLPLPVRRLPRAGAVGNAPRRRSPARRAPLGAGLPGSPRI